ncbi:hypothetical protein SDC9_164988 [bioreactor metagenome]|uniref:Uncharacterized protein n=1 Tax=bioreactor metagenome TaxID=1076179 RepID=A0A645G0E1_9ZZZZ
MDAGTHPVSGAKLGHPHEHDDAQLLSPTEVEGQQPVLHHGNVIAGGIAVHHRDKNDEGRSPHQEGDDQLFQMVK